MNFKRFIILLLISFFVIGATTSCIKTDLQCISLYEEKDKEIIVETKQAEIHVEKDYLTKKEIYILAEKIENGIVEVENFLTETYLKRNTSDSKIKYYIKSDKFISNAKNGLIRLSHVKEKKSPYLHETVHILASYNVKKKWLSEGLAVYLNDKYDGYPSFPNFGKNLDGISQNIINDEELKEVLSFHNKYTNLNVVSQKQRQAFYIVSGSLVKYIENEYGKEKLMEIYNYADIKDVLNKSFDELKNEWIIYIQRLN